jgi:preprotein translocase subunit YajC
MHLLDFAIFAVTPTPAAPSSLAQGIQGFLPMILLFVVFYFLLIRPQVKKQKEHQKLISSLQSGDAVVTNAGIHGVITNVKDRTVIVRVADNVKLEFDRAAIASVTREPEKTA